MIRFFRHYIPLSMFMLTVVEFLFFFLISGFAADYYGRAAGVSAEAHSGYKPWLFASILTLLNSTFGLYDWEWTKGLSSLLLRVVGSVFIGAALIGLGGHLLPDAFPVGGEYLVAPAKFI